MIETPRLLLDELRRSDLDDFVRLYSDPQVAKFIGNGRPDDGAETEAWLEKALAHWQEHGFGTWSIRLRETGEFMGRAGLTVRDLEHGPEVEIGYVLAAKHWHQGYATEAAVAARDHGVRNLDLRRLVALIDYDNEASKRVAVKLEMVYERQVRFGSRWRELGRMVDLFAWERTAS
jgi:RimJ/RimL family protein N-acetyltransferase